MSRVVLREFNRDQDVGLILDTFAKGVYHGGINRPVGGKKSWFEEFHKYVLELLDNADIFIACSDFDQSHILGYAIIEDRCLEYVYVKEWYRNNGIASLLTHDRFNDINHANITKAGQAIIDRQDREADLTP